jgi:hypothetical protein
LSEERILLGVAGADRGTARRQPDGGPALGSQLCFGVCCGGGDKSRAEQSSWSDDNEEQRVREKERDKARPVRAEAEAEVWE